MDILKLNKYEERSYRETPNSQGFVNYGDDNLFPQYLVDLYHSSATHNALSTTIAMMIFGEGFDASDLDGRLAFDQWNLNDELRKACLDFKIQGGFALEVNWSIDRTTIANTSVRVSAMKRRKSITTIIPKIGKTEKRNPSRYVLST